MCEDKLPDDQLDILEEHWAKQMEEDNKRLGLK
jgi:hypothetical protein